MNLLIIHIICREAHSINIYSASETYNELPYKLGQIEGKGEGVIATRDLAPGDYIASEKAKLRWHVTEESFYRLEWMLSKLSEEDRAKYYRLYNCYTREAFGCPDEQLPPDIIGKWKTNCFGIEADYQIVLLDVITKINHACRENVTRYYCAKTETMTVVACDYIEKGQELVQSYMDILQDCNYRRYNAILAWGFLCMCDVCDQSPADLQVSDKRRVRIARIRDVELPKQKDRPEQCIELVSTLPCSDA